MTNPETDLLNPVPSLWFSVLSRNISLEERDCQPFFRGIFHSLTCQLSSLPREEFSEHKLRGSGHRTISPPNERVRHQTGERRVTSNTASPCVFLHLPRIATPSFRRRPKALWDANSTTVCWGCQGDIPIYCIPVLTSGMLAPTSGFPQTAFPGNHSWLLKTAKKDKRKNPEWHDCNPCHPNLPRFRFCGRSFSRRHLGTGRAPTLQIRNRKVTPR